jgi:hypothetical protein
MGKNRKVEGSLKVADLAINEWLEFSPADANFGVNKIVIRKQKATGYTFNKVTVRLIGGIIYEGFEGEPKPFETTFQVGLKAINAIWQEFHGSDYPYSTEEQDLSLDAIAWLAALKYNLSLTVGYRPTYGNKVTQ